MRLRRRPTLSLAAKRRLEHDARGLIGTGLRERPALGETTTAASDLDAGEWESALIDFIECAPDLVPAEMVDRFDVYLEDFGYDMFRVVGREKIAGYRARQV